MASYFGFDACDIAAGPYVFISYKTEDSEQVAKYAEYLHDNGINVWYDNGLHAGSDWESYLMTVIENPNCKAVLLFVSANVAKSTVIPLETTQARICKKPTVAIYLESGLDLEHLLSKAIKIYVEQRQSVNAYIGSQESICREILGAAMKAMENVSVSTAKPAEDLWTNALVFLRNSERSRNMNDIGKARGYLETMTRQSPADYRGWLGLALCECLPRVENIDDAAKRLESAAGYYSYVVSIGSDSNASDYYTRIKSNMWDELISLIEKELDNCTDREALLSLHSKADSLGDRMGHTEAYIREKYLRLISRMNTELHKFEEQDRLHKAVSAALLQKKKKKRKVLVSIAVIAAILLILAAVAAYIQYYC